MADNVKNKTLFLKELLEEHTDADHGLTMEELQRLYDLFTADDSQ